MIIVIKARNKGLLAWAKNRGYRGSRNISKELTLIQQYALRINCVPGTEDEVVSKLRHGPCYHGDGRLVTMLLPVILAILLDP